MNYDLYFHQRRWHSRSHGAGDMGYKASAHNSLGRVWNTVPLFPKALSQVLIEAEMFGKLGFSQSNWKRHPHGLVSVPCCGTSDAPSHLLQAPTSNCTGRNPQLSNWLYTQRSIYPCIPNLSPCISCPLPMLTPLLTHNSWNSKSFKKFVNVNVNDLTQNWY